MNVNQALATVALLFLCATVMDVADAARYVPKWKKQASYIAVAFYHLSIYLLLIIFCFVLQACEVPASQNEQSHYTCDDNGEVKCLPGKIGLAIQFAANWLIHRTA